MSAAVGRLSPKDRKTLRHAMRSPGGDPEVSDIEAAVELIVQRHVAAAVAAFKAEAVAAIEKRRVGAWEAYVNGGGGHLEALRQGRLEGLDVAKVIVRNLT